MSDDRKRKGSSKAAPRRFSPYYAPLEPSKDAATQRLNRAYQLSEESGGSEATRKKMFYDIARQKRRGRRKSRRK